MRGRTLLELKNELRAECRLSLNSAHNTQWNDHQTLFLQRAQEDAWDEFNWPHLRVEREVALQAGQRYMALPCDISIDRLDWIEVRYGSIWQRLYYGIGPGQYEQWDSQLDIRSWPVARWRIWEDEQVEVWPVPSLNADPVSLDGTLKFCGIRNLKPLVKDDDRADLDDWLIVLPVASRILTSTGKPDDKILAGQVQRRLMRLRGQLVKKRSFRLFGGGSNDGPRLQGPPRVQVRIEPVG